MTENEIINRLHLHGKTMTQDEAFFIMDALEEIQQYRAIGTVEELKALEENERKCEDCGGCTAWKCDCANVRANAIDEFVNAVKEKFPDDRNGIANIERIAEQLKGAKE